MKANCLGKMFKSLGKISLQIFAAINRTFIRKMSQMKEIFSYSNPLNMHSFCILLLLWGFVVFVGFFCFGVFFNFILFNLAYYGSFNENKGKWVGASSNQDARNSFA